MATIRTAIELQDNFSGILYGITNAVNMSLSVMEDLNRAMNEPVDTTSIQAAREAINQATVAAQQWEAAMQNVDAPQTSTPTTPQPSTPQPVPVQWQSDSMDVFTTSGVERFQQEIQSANSMLNTLNTTQERIAATAAGTDMFPASAVADMNSMQSRLQAIQQRIQQIESNPMNMGTDTANAELEQLRSQLNQAVQDQEDLNRAMERMDVSAANEAYLRLSNTVSNTERYIRDNTDEQGRFNRAIDEGAQGAGDLMNMIKGAVAAYASVQTIGKVMDLSDQLTSTTARINLMNDGLQSTQDLQNMIYLSAERSRGAYQTTADAVSKLGLMAGDAFSSSEEIIAFTEQLNKQFTIAGTEAAGIDAAMLQLTQAMGSGVLRGEEYNSILEQAPNIIQAIADYMEVPKGQLKDMAAEGQITAEIVKNAMFAAADETNAKFESMPKTFNQIWTSFQNNALMAFQPVLQRLNDIANSESFQTFVNGAIEALSMVAGIVVEIFNLIASVGTMIADNWSWLSPIIYGVAAALLVYYGRLMLVRGAELALAAVQGVVAVAKGILAAATMLVTGATWAQTTAQYGLNAAMYACPIVWIIILIIALIALFYAAVAAVNKFAGTSVSATGIICGVFMVAAAFIGNLFVALINFVIDIFVVLWNFIAAFANFFGNVFNDPVGAIARLFFDLVDTVLSLLQSLASAIDTIFGSNLAGAVQGWRDSLGGWVDSTFGQGEEIMAKLNAEDLHLDRFEYSSAWDAGYSFGEGIDESIANFDPSSLFDTNVPGAGDYADLSNYGSDLGGLGGIGSGVDDIAGNTGAIADSMDITEEDLKYLRDIAEQEAVNRFTTAEISVDMSGMQNNISNGMDLDGVISGLTEGVNEAIDSMAEGVHD
nr:MAG: Nucleoporin FG repeated region protein [Bacteriophage sp.]